MKYWGLAFLILGIILTTFALDCNRVPQGVMSDKSPVDENYIVSIEGNPSSYVPGQKYNVSLSSHNGLTFISFMLALEKENGDVANPETVGFFEIADLTETRFSPRCPNMIENRNTNIKTHIDVVWEAPSSTGNGCIFIRATVSQHRDVWFMDDGFLTKKICEESIDDIDSQPSIMDPCCACDEAKYELTFEGKWSRHTHPKDFPANSWRTRFSDIIGASHTVDYRFWRYGELASEGLREVAEHGSTRTLESELKDQSDQIRTIIKARGIAYPNVTGKTFAVFRVDSKHHLISLVSMIDPSPDWIVGVSGLELCLPNCSWIESKIHNLYPWDAGTDSGPSYMSADQPQVPPDVIRRIKSNFPNDPRSPFNDPNGAPMKPLATLHINRRRLYEKTCDNSDSDSDLIECTTSPWSSWSECSSNCGSGKQYRTREFRNPSLAHRSKCTNTLREEQNCVGEMCNSSNGENIGNNDVEYTNKMENPECAVSEWSEWSTCSATCGAGVKTRTRHYLNRRAKKKCQKVSKTKLQETIECSGIECGGDIDNADNEADTNNIGLNEQSFQTKSFDDQRFLQFESFSHKREDYIPPECGVSPWSDFSPCTGPCGGIGQRIRERKVWNYIEIYGIKDVSNNGLNPCDDIKRVETVNCSNPSCDVIVPSHCFESLKVSHCRDSDVTNFWFYDHISDQCAIFWADKCDTNRNKFNSKEDCEQTCQHPYRKQQLQNRNINLEQHKVDCLVSNWQEHACNATCGEGMQIKTRKVLRSPKYGGKPCPRHLVHFSKCYHHCNDQDEYKSNSFDKTGSAGYQNENSNNYVTSDIECHYSDWSAWSPCTASCGDKAVRQKTRTLLNTKYSYKCKDRVRTEKCIVMPCLDDE